MGITRNSYLVNKVFKQYILINIMTSLALSLGVIVDSIIVGNLLGDKSLVAITLSMPAILLFGMLSALINGGGSVLATIEIGKGNYNKVTQIFTTAMVLSIIAGLLLCLLGVVYIDQIVAILCSEESVAPLVKSYISIVLYTAPIYLLFSWICSFLRIDSAQKIVFISLVTANVINLILDYSFIKFFGFGIESSSIASAIGFFIGFMTGLFHFRNKGKLLRLSSLSPLKEWHKSLVVGFPMAIESLSAAFIVLFLNHTIGVELGVLGLSILAVCSHMLSLAGLFTGGVFQTMQPLCGVLFGNDDHSGIQFSIRTAFIFLLTGLVAVTIFVELFPLQFASLFGLNVIEHDQVISDAIRVFAFTIPISGIVALLSSLYIIMREEKKAIIITIINSFIIIPIIYILKDVEGIYIWGSFALSELITFFCILYLKIPVISTRKVLPHNNNILDVSLNNTVKDITEFDERLTIFLRSNRPPDVLDDRILEIHYDIMKSLNTSAHWRNIDIIVKINDDDIRFISKDDAPYHSEYTWVLGQNNRLFNYTFKN